MVTAHLQTELLWAGRKREPESHLVETSIASLMPPKLCWFTPPEKDQVGPGETASMPSKG